MYIRPNNSNGKVIPFYQYVLVMIEHFLKWLELMPLLDHSNESATYAFVDMKLNKFGIPIGTLVN